MAGEGDRAGPERGRAAAVEIVRALRGAGHVAYLAGGCVRDELLGLHPKDYDVATDAAPGRVRGMFPRTAEVGAAFGVVLVRMGPATVEVATFRSEGAYSDRRRPDSISFSDPETDARRRDFTINALFLDPLAEEGRGRVVDFVGGMEDLRRGVLRAVGDPEERLSEDHLRALRAVRLAARLDFEIEAPTAAAIVRHARDLAGVSRERIGDELRRMMAHPSRATAAALVQQLELDDPVLGGHVEHPPALLDKLEPAPPFATCLAAWAVDRERGLGDEGAIRGLVNAWRRRLCLSNEEREAFLGALAGLGVLTRRWGEMGVAGRKRAASSGWFGESMRLLSGADPVLEARVRVEVAELASEGGLAPEPIVTGDDLIAAGMAPGPRFKELLERVYDAQLEGRVGSKAQGVELARRLGV